MLREAVERMEGRNIRLVLVERTARRDEGTVLVKAWTWTAAAATTAAAKSPTVERFRWGIMGNHGQSSSAAVLFEKVRAGWIKPLGRPLN